MRKPSARGVAAVTTRSIEEAARELAVRVDAPIAEKRPVRARRLDRAEVARYDEPLLATDARARQHAPRRVDDEAPPPELDAVAAERPLAPHAVRHRDEDAVRDRVAP